MSKKNIKRIISVTIATLLVVLGLALISVNFSNKEALASGITQPFKYELKPNHIVIPKIKLNEQIYKDPNPGIVTDATLSKGPSYYDQNTDDPGQQNCAIFGHSAKTADHGAPFAHVNEKEVGVGDEIILTDGSNKTYKYKVDQIKVIASNDFSVIKPTDKPVVTLITCIAPDYPRDKRLVIRASLE